MWAPLLALALQAPAPPPPSTPWTPQPQRWAFCDAVGKNAVFVEGLKKDVATVRVAPLVVLLSHEAPRVVVPSHVEERWPRREVPISCLTETQSLTGAQRSVELLSAPELVFGCSQDPVGATFVETPLWRAAQQPPRPGVCLRHMDARAPCPRISQEEEDAAPDAAEAETRFTRARKEAEAQTRQLLARVVPRYARGGPALHLRVRPEAGTRRLFLVERLLQSESCGCGEDAAEVTSTRVVPLQVPDLPGDLEVWVPVPRYTGAAYDLVVAEDEESLDADAVGRMSYSDAFVAEPPEDPAAMRAFSAPEACPCDCGP